MEVRRKPQLGANDEAAVDCDVDRPSADDGEDDVHAQVEQQEEERHGLEVIDHFDRILPAALSIDLSLSISLKVTN